MNKSHSGYGWGKFSLEKHQWWFLCTLFKLENNWYEPWDFSLWSGQKVGKGKDLINFWLLSSLYSCLNMAEMTTHCLSRSISSPALTDNFWDKKPLPVCCCYGNSEGPASWALSGACPGWNLRRLPGRGTNQIKPLQNSSSEVKRRFQASSITMKEGEWSKGNQNTPHPDFHLSF